MTKKFWADWQSRIGETKAIYIASNVDGNSTKYRYNIFHRRCDKIIYIHFIGDYVQMTIERESVHFNSRTWSETRHYQNYNYKLHRTEIISVDFFKQ